jgi:hypothetical protein
MNDYLPVQSPMYASGQRRHAQLFSVRLWQEAMGGGVYETRGQVCHVLSGEVRYFCAWADLVAFLQDKVELPSAASVPSPTVEGIGAPQEYE